MDGVVAGRHFLTSARLAALDGHGDHRNERVANRPGAAMPHISADQLASRQRQSTVPPPALMPNGDPILAARFAVPPIPKTYVRRPRLIQQLSENMLCPLTLVNGPAGAGKTLLAADWIRSAPAPGPAAWLTLEHGDDAPGVFWAYVLAALRRHGLVLPENIGTPARANEVDSHLLARLSVHLSSLGEPLLLVLDEFERVTSAEIASQVQFLLRHARPGLRLALISRTEPLLPLHRYRAAGEITEIRAADLAFTQQETADLLCRHGLSLSAEGARALTERTQGWAAGIRLSALATQRAADPESFLKEFEAGQSTVADFLLAEVLDTQSVETQDLLLRTSILDQTHPDLANALTGRQDAAPLLFRLQRANAFIEPMGHSWYRHHPLFAEILQVHLRARHPGLETELHRRAARWLCTAGRLADALPHAAAGDWEFAASQFVDNLAIGRLFTGLDALRLSDLFATMPPETAGPAPELIRAACELAHYDLDSGLDHLRKAGKHLHDDSPVGTSTVQLSYAFLLALEGRLLGSADMAQAAADTAERLEREVPAKLLDDHPELPALLQTDLGSALLWAGRFEAAQAVLSTAARTAEGPTTAYPRHESLSRLALIEVLRGWLAKAESHAQAALSQAECRGLPPSSRTGVGQLVLAAVAIDRDNLRTARTALKIAAQSSAAHHDPIVAMGLTILRSRLLLARGDPQGALDVLDTDKPTPTAAPSPWVNDALALAAAAAHLAEGDPRAAMAALEKGSDAPQCATAAARARLACGESETARQILDSIPGDIGSGPAVTVRALLARAQTALALGDEPTGRRLLARALSCARPEHLRLPFLESGPWLRRLLHSHPELTQAHDWLPPGLLTGPHRPESDATMASPVAEPLSERELDVLARTAQMMSTQEIAADLCLSVNTVKTHLKSINRKLCATRRGQAVRRAKELHLL
ncbi:LuxR C-terminal-related transcriptional regulator [Streptacidiphilus sp. EB129]|uniref:LuxR C-terminal-related transcriptional regulator n=1 Tax=Streptacidiphilus sp. EB129 TaxID=3156262 RepID=UPI0035131703